MRASSLLTLACAVAAFILTILCLLSGYKRDFLQSTDLLTLNLSGLGHGSLFNTSDGDGGFLSTLGNELQGDINDIINDLGEDIAQALDLPDFFNVHVMDFCQGTYSPNTTAKHIKKNVTECSNSTLSFHFEPTEYVQKHLPDGITLDDIHWPDAVRDAEKTIKAVSRVMVIFYIIGIIFAGLAMITALLGIFFDGRVSAFINWVVDLLAFATIGVASAVATAVMVIAADKINNFRDDVGISASKGGRFLAMTWAATAVMLLASLVSIVQCCVGRRSKKQRRYSKEGY